MDSNSPYCEVCDKHFSGWTPYQEHIQSPVHEKAIENHQNMVKLSKSLMNPSPNLDEVNLEKLDEFMITEDKNLYFCRLCHVPCSGKIPALNHCLGKSHRKQKQRHQLSMSSSLQPLSGSALFSSGSNQSTSSGMIDQRKSTPWTPVSSNDMLNNTTNSNLPSDFSVFKTNPLTGHFLCTVCNLSVSGLIPAEQHIKGKAHIKKAKRKSTLNSFLNDASDLESHFSQLHVSDSTNDRVNVSEGDENSMVKENESKLRDNSFPSPLSRLHNNVSVEGGDHLDGEKEVKVQEKEVDLEVDNVTGHWKCKVCQVTLTGEEPIKQHLAGKTHQKKKRAAGMDQEMSRVLPLVSSDFSLPSHRAFPASPYQIKGGLPIEMSSDVPQNSYHPERRAATEQARNPETNLAGPQVSPYLVQQHNLKTDGVSSYPDLTGSQVTKDVLARENLKLAEQLSSPSSLGGEVTSPYNHKGVRSNPPMSDFLQHQRTAGMRQNMGNFWSMQPSPSDFHSPQENRYDGDTTSATSSKPMDPIGTPPHSKTDGDSTATKLKGQDPVKEYFDLVSSSGKLTCRVCEVTVSGLEPARQHLQGKSHLKRQRAYEFNQNHMAPFTSTPPKGCEGHHQMSHHGTPDLGFSLHQEGFPSSTSPQTRQQNMTSPSSPRQQEAQTHYLRHTDSRHGRTPGNSEQYHHPHQQQGSSMRAPHPDQFDMKSHLKGHHPSGQNKGHHHSKSPPSSPKTSGTYRGPVPQSHLDSYSSSSYHSTSQFSDDRPHSLRGVSLAENLH